MNPGSIWTREHPQMWLDHDHGFPLNVISDRGIQFVSQFSKELYQALGIKGNPSFAYHPQTGGETKWVNQYLKEFVMMFINDKQDNWSEWLPITQFCHNLLPKLQMTSSEGT
ncbi:hypothetical protein AX14_008067 [Amanita brunnescens Koide BX004]|jgi:hypothetical protein|nr:hypothetical protein AX14_008067 [Amanita brunnescens Koide BX004]